MGYTSNWAQDKQWLFWLKEFGDYNNITFSITANGEGGTGWSPRVNASISTGVWTHIVGTWDGTHIRIFKNGSAISETEATGELGDTSSPIRMGSTGGEKFDGGLDEVTIWDRALSSEEISELYESYASPASIDSISPNPVKQDYLVHFRGHCEQDGETFIRYAWRSSIDGELHNGTEANFTIPASQLTQGSHTIYFKAQNENGNWSSESSRTLTVLPPNQPPTASIGSIAPNPVTLGEGGSPLDEYTVAYWSFDEAEGTTAYDSSGNGNDGTLENGVQWVDGKYGKALEFDGVDDYVDIGNNQFLPTTAITISMWIQTSATDEVDLFISDQSYSTYTFRIEDNEFYFRIIPQTSTTSGQTIITSTSSVSDNYWHHIVGTWDGSDMKLYIDGSLNVSESMTTSPVSFNSDNAELGRFPSSAAYYNGKIDEVAIWNRALSSEEISRLYHGYEYVTFTGSASDSDGTVVAYEWSSSLDGFLSNQSIFSYNSSLLTVGNHTISFRAQDDEGAWSDYATSWLEVLPPPNKPPTAVLDSVEPDEAPGGTLVNFSGHGLDEDGVIVGYLWESSRDGPIGTTATINSTNLSLGFHYITFQVVDDDGNWSEAVGDGIWIYAPPVALAGPDVNALQHGAVQFNGQGSDEDGVVVFWEWDFDGNGIYEWSSTQNGLVTYAYAVPGTFIAELRVTDNDGFSSSDKVKIVVLPTVTPSDEDSLPSGSNITFALILMVVAVIAALALRRRSH
jgi:hypothetical protein